MKKVKVSNEYLFVKACLDRLNKEQSSSEQIPKLYPKENKECSEVK